MDLRELGHFLEFTLKLQPLLFLIISIVAVYLSFKMLSNAKASRTHEERMKLAEVKMNIRSLFAKSMDNLTEIYGQHNIAFIKLQTYFPSYASVNLNKQKEMLDLSKAQLEEVEEIYKNYIENIESSIALEDSIKFLLEMQGSCFVSPRNSIYTEKIFDDILQRAEDLEDLEKQLSKIKKNRIRDKSDFHN